jgi:putative tryptophan/tyrosine transport system substrate-binding protein
VTNRFLYRRREFITLVVGAVGAWPLVVRAQQAKAPIIGFLHQGASGANKDFVAKFRQGLREGGYVEGQNVTIEFRWAEGHYDRLPTLASDLVGRQVHVIAATYLPAARAAKAATSTIPIVFFSGSDPVGSGLVVGLNRPDGNVTGVYMITGMLGAKRLELLRELVPGAQVVAVLVNPANANAQANAREVQSAGLAVGQRIELLSVSDERELETAFAKLAQLHPGALFVSPDTFLQDRREQLIAWAANHGVPAIYYQRDFVAAGGLMSYGPDNNEGYRWAGIYTGRILKGEKPADLPVMQPTKFELVLNLKTATALGLTIPPTLLARADEVIE